MRSIFLIGITSVWPASPDPSVHDALPKFGTTSTNHAALGFNQLSDTRGSPQGQRRSVRYRAYARAHSLVNPPLYLPTTWPAAQRITPNLCGWMSHRRNLPISLSNTPLVKGYILFNHCGRIDLFPMAPQRMTLSVRGGSPRLQPRRPTLIVPIGDRSALRLPIQGVTPIDRHGWSISGAHCGRNSGNINRTWLGHPSPEWSRVWSVLSVLSAR